MPTGIMPTCPSRSSIPRGREPCSRRRASRGTRKGDCTSRRSSGWPQLRPADRTELRRTVMEARNLEKRYPVVTGVRSLFSSDRGKHVHAVDGIDFHVERGEVLGLVGESGCGKSTTAKLLVGLETPTGGTITLDD